MSRDSDERYNHGLNKLKLYQLGYYLELDEVEYFENNDQYIKAAITLCNEIIGDTRYFLERPAPEIFENKSELYSDKMNELEEKRMKGEERADKKFASTEFFDQFPLSKEERTIIFLLLSKRGVGIKPKRAILKGETIIHALKLTENLDLEKSRKLLYRDSKLRESSVIKTKDPRRRRPGPRSRSDGDRHIESTAFYLGSRPSKAILDKGCIEIEEGENGKDRPRKKKNLKENLMEKIDSKVSFSDVVLPQELKDSILSLLAQEGSKNKFLEEWNMKSVLGNRKGLNLLFSGPSGTGKTMTAKAIGNRLNRDVYRVSLSDVINLWHGETEKNITRMFDQMEEKEAVVLLDEAEALLNKRTGAKTSTDATEGRMVNLILQELEDHSGVMIMTTNLAKNIDPALERRMDLKAKFPLPDAGAREEIWEYHLPEELPLDEDVDISQLARMYEFSGGKIRNAVVNAARHSLKDEKDTVSQEDLKKACRREKEGEEAMEYEIKDRKGTDSKRYA